MTAPGFLYITEAEVEQRLTMPAVIEAVEHAFRQLAAGQAQNVPRYRVKGRGIVLHSMSASADYLGLVGWKQYTTTRTGAVFHVGVYDQSSGQLRALIEADRLGQMRTGATTAIAVRYLTTADANKVGLIGTGWQAESQLAAIAAVRPLQQVRVFSRDVSRRETFASRMADRLSLSIQAVNSAQQAVEDAQIVVTATTSRQPVIDASALRDQQLVAAIGSNWPEKSELEMETIRTAKRIVCDSIEACQREAGELIMAEAAGAFSWQNAHELGTIVTRDPSDSLNGLTVFKSVGMAVEDLAVAALLLS